MMKKLLLTVIIFCLCLCGCKNFGADSGADSDVVRYSISGTTVTVRKNNSGFELTLGEDDAKEFFSIMNTSEWEEGCLKYRGDYRFVIDGQESTLEYFSEKGLFLDHSQNKQLFLTKQQKEYIDKIFQVKAEEAATDTEAYEHATDTQNITETEKELNNISSEIKNGMSYSEVIAILGEEYNELDSGYFWTLFDGSTLKISFDKVPNDEWSVNDFYNYTFKETGIKRPTDASEVERMTVSYMGYKARAIEISNAEVISEIVEMIKTAETDYVESSRGYYGCAYGIEILLKSGETFYFDIWGENMFSTNECKDNNRYDVVSHTDISELYKYMEEHFPEEKFIN